MGLLITANYNNTTDVALIGGGTVPRPGEVSMAHHGVLFLDEMPEFHRDVLEALRQPLEDRVVTVSRARSSLTFPASFMLVGAMNPCPCGFYGDPVRACTCSSSTITRYQKRISGPLLDRIDIHIEVPRVEYEKLSDDRLGEPSQAVQARVEAARERQRERFGGDGRESGSVVEVGSHSEARTVYEGAGLGNVTCNADMRPVEVRRFCRLEETESSLMRTAMNQLQLSARAYHRVLKLARTIADLAGDEQIGTAHLGEALQYRAKGN